MEEKHGCLRLIGSRDGRDGSVTIHQDLSLYAAVLDAGDSVSHDITNGRKGWVQVTRGAVTLNDQPLSTGDGVAVTGPADLVLSGSLQDAEVLLCDMVE